MQVSVCSGVCVCWYTCSACEDIGYWECLMLTVVYMYMKNCLVWSGMLDWTRRVGMGMGSVSWSWPESWLWWWVLWVVVVISLFDLIN